MSRRTVTGMNLSNSNSFAATLDTIRPGSELPWLFRLLTPDQTRR